MNPGIKSKMLKKNISKWKFEKFQNQHFPFVFLEISFVFLYLDFPTEDKEGKLLKLWEMHFFIDWNDISLGQMFLKTFLQIGTP